MSYTDQEILYAMFVLKANRYDWECLSEVLDDKNFITIALNGYSDLFVDRAECEEEFEGYVADHFKKFLTDKHSQNQDALGLVCRWANVDEKHKIKFRFEN